MAKKKSGRAAKAKKTSAKKTPGKKTAAKKTSAKKTPVKKTPVKKKAPTKKTPAKKAPAKKASPAQKRRGSAGEALLRAMTVAMIADGSIEPSERDILKQFVHQPAFLGIDVVGVVDSTIQRCIDEGPEEVLTDITATLTTTDERETAFSTCLAIVATDGRVTSSEARMLRALVASLEIPIARARALAGPIAAVLD